MRNILQSGFSWMSKKIVRPLDADESQDQVRPKLVEVSDIRYSEAVDSAPVAVAEPAAIVEIEPIHAIHTIEAVPANLEISIPEVVIEEEIAPEIAPIPLATIEPIKHEFVGEVTMMIRGSKAYGTCPRCQAMFNIKERLTDPRRVHQIGVKELSCPSCDGVVSLPTSVDIRKLN